MKKSFLFILMIALQQITYSQTTKNFTVILRSDAGKHMLWDSTLVNIWGFASTLSGQPLLPGKTLYANEGDTLRIKAWNVSQNHHHTIHLHGLDVDTQNDGDPMTSFSLGHMEDTIYTFVATHPGTYIYHCHVGDVVHVQMGMYGLIVIKAKGGKNEAWTNGPSYSKEYAWLMTELDKSWHDTVPEHDHQNGLITLPSYNPDYFFINGKSKQQLTDSSMIVKGAVGEKIYVRLANIGFFNNTVIFPAALHAEIIDSDGRPLPQKEISDTVRLSPGERYGVMIRASTEMNEMILVQFENMNSHQVWETEKIPVVINGFLGIESNNQLADIVVYPNPFNQKLRVEGFQSFMYSFNVYNRYGSIVFNGKLADTQEIDLNSLSDGIYILELKGNDQVFRKKIVKSSN
jgi:FtsP/CotA-like multicopper oxidase with cupredoxin domain